MPKIKQLFRRLFTRTQVDQQGSAQPRDITETIGVGGVAGVVAYWITEVISQSLPLLPRLISDPETNAAVTGALVAVLWLAKRFRGGVPVISAPPAGTKITALRVVPVGPVSVKSEVSE